MVLKSIPDVHPLSVSKYPFPFHNCHLPDFTPINRNYLQLLSRMNARAHTHTHAFVYLISHAGLFDLETHNLETMRTAKGKKKRRKKKGNVLRFSQVSLNYSFIF